MLLPSRNISAGTGLAGGGTILHSDRAFSLVTGSSAGTAAAGNDSRFSDWYSTIRSSDLTMSASSATSLGMALTYAAGETWTIQYVLHIQTTAGVGGIGFSLNTLPTGVVGRLAVLGPTSSLGSIAQVATTTLTTPIGAVFTFSGSGVVQGFLTVRGGSGSGTIDLMLTTGLLQAGTVFRESQIWARRN